MGCDGPFHSVVRYGTQPTPTSSGNSGAVTTWGMRGTLAAIGVAAVIAGLGGAAVYAATDEGPGAGFVHGPPPAPFDRR